MSRNRRIAPLSELVIPRWGRRLLFLTEAIYNRMEILMSRLDDVLAEIDQATNDIASELESLRSAVASGDSSAADRIQPLADRLRGLAVDPSNPVPTTTPTDSTGGAGDPSVPAPQ